jgi:aryl-alcohol dehydrogenase-like predicted oxidoreductase
LKYTKFGRTGLQVSRLILGTGTFGGQASEEEAQRMLDMAAGAGVNFIDTADMYPPGPNPGVAESIVGRWLKSKRHQCIVATKGGGKIGPLAWDSGTSRKHLLDAIDGSLRRLNTDYVDLYQLHMDDPNTPLEETLEAMDVIVRSGKSRYIGVSNFLAYRLAKALGWQSYQRLVRFVSIQPRYNLLYREPEREILPLAREEGLAVIPYNPLAGGLLSDRYQFTDQPQKGRFSAELGSFGAMYKARYWREREFSTVEKVRDLARQQGVAASTLSIAWLLANPAVTSVILGASNSQHLIDTLAAVDLDLGATCRSALEELSGQYC